MYVLFFSFCQPPALAVTFIYMEAKKACLQFAECSLSYAKIRQKVGYRKESINKCLKIA